MFLIEAYSQQDLTAGQPGHIAEVPTRADAQSVLEDLVGAGAPVPVMEGELAPVKGRWQLVRLGVCA